MSIVLNMIVAIFSIAFISMIISIFLKLFVKIFDSDHLDSKKHEDIIKSKNVVEEMLFSVRYGIIGSIYMSSKTSKFSSSFKTFIQQSELNENGMEEIIDEISKSYLKNYLKNFYEMASFVIMKENSEIEINKGDDPSMYPELVSKVKDSVNLFFLESSKSFKKKQKQKKKNEESKRRNVMQKIKDIFFNNNNDIDDMEPKDFQQILHNLTHAKKISEPDSYYLLNCTMVHILLFNTRVVEVPIEENNKDSTKVMKPVYKLIFTTDPQFIYKSSSNNHNIFCDFTWFLKNSRYIEKRFLVQLEDKLFVYCSLLDIALVYVRHINILKEKTESRFIKFIDDYSIFVEDYRALSCFLHQYVSDMKSLSEYELKDYHPFYRFSIHNFIDLKSKEFEKELRPKVDEKLFRKC